MTPQSGVVEAGGAATLSVGFKAGAEAEAFANRLSIDIADRDPKVVAPEYIPNPNPNPDPNPNQDGRARV